MVLLALFMIAHSVWAQNVGVVFLQGDVKAGPAGQLQKLKLGARIPHGHSVKTGAGGTVILTYPNESRIKVKENSELTIQAPANPQEMSGADLVVGAVFSMVRRSAGQSFRVKTPIGVAGVRGTQFFTSHDVSGRTWVCVNEGEVEMRKENGAGVAVTAGLGVLVEREKEIAPPKKYKWTEKLNWNMDSATGDVIDRTKIDGYDILKKNYD